MPRIAAVLLVVALLGAGLPAGVGAAADWSIAGGHFYTQAGAGRGGFAVIDDDRAAFWREFRRVGGVAAVGYPISRRFEWDGFLVQAFQRVVFQWRPECGCVYFVNVFDRLSQLGLDDWLRVHRQTPPPAAWSEAGLGWEEVLAGRLAALDGWPRLRAAYHGVAGDPVQANGLPTTRVVDMGNHFALRAQRVVFQEWKEDVPWAKKGQVTVALGGDIAKETGVLPSRAALAPIDPDAGTPEAEAVRPAPTPPVSGTAPRLGPMVVLDPGHGGAEIGAAVGSVVEKDVNLEIARRTRDHLRAAGLRVALTRDGDREVNVGGADYNGDGRVDVDDDLQARVDVANANGATLLVSIHANGSPNVAMRGLTTYWCDDGIRAADSLRLARALHAGMWSRLGRFGTRDLGVQDDGNLGKPYGHLFLLGARTPRVARAPTMPVALVEILFISNSLDRALLASAEVRAEAAAGLAQGILNALP